MKPAVTADVLRRVPLFAGLPAALLDDVAREARLVFRKKSSRIFEEGSDADRCFLLIAGRAKVVLADAADGQISLNVLERFALIGEIALLDNSKRSAGLVAIDDCHLVEIGRRTFLALRNDRAFEDRLVAHVVATLRRATEQIWGWARLKEPSKTGSEWPGPLCGPDLEQPRA